MDPDEEAVTVFVTTGPDLAQRCATPFYMASMAAAMDNEAEMIFQIDGVLLLKKGVAEEMVAKEGGKKIIDHSLLPDPGVGQRVAKYTFRPREFQLQTGDEVIYRAVARDNRTDVRDVDEFVDRCFFDRG